MPFNIVPTSAAELVARIKAEAPANADWVFDCDGTLIRGDIASLSAWAVIRVGLAHPELLPPEWNEFSKLPFDYSAFRRLRQVIIDQRGISAIYEWEAFLHSGLTPTISRDVARFAVKEGLSIGSLELTHPVSDLAKHFAERAWIVSGSPDMCVSAIAELLNVPDERVIGSKLEMVDGVYSAKIMPPGIIWEDLKRKELLRHGVRYPYFVAGDTIGDWQMFELSQGWCWCVIWGKHRHRGEEFREAIQRSVLGPNGATLPTEPGIYLYEQVDKHWVFEIRGAG